MNTSELLHNIAKDRIQGLETVTNYQLKPVIILIEDEHFTIDLNNDIYILNTRSLPAELQTLSLKSSDNVFSASLQEYDLMDEFRYQSFTDYIDVQTSFLNDFTPYRLEFIKVIPHRSNE